MEINMNHFVRAFKVLAIIFSKIFVILSAALAILAAIATITGYTLKDMPPGRLDGIVNIARRFLELVTQPVSAPLWMVLLISSIGIMCFFAMLRHCYLLPRRDIKVFLRSLETPKKSIVQSMVDVWDNVDMEKVHSNYSFNLDDFAGTLAERAFYIERLSNEALTRADHNSKLIWSNGLSVLRDIKDTYLDKGRGSSENFNLAYDFGYHKYHKDGKPPKGYVLEIISHSASLLWWISKLSILLKQESLFTHYVINRMLNEPKTKSEDILLQWNVYIEQHNSAIVGDVLQEARDFGKSPILYRSDFHLFAPTDGIANSKPDSS
jgi:hypothetical protein